MGENRIGMSDSITVASLTDAGYREYPVPSIFKYDRLFQKRMDSADGAMYFVNFREWRHPDRTTYDADLCCETASGGTIWVTIKEESIRATELRAAAIWAAVGSVYYDA
jgi:hypothetical protein